MKIDRPGEAILWACSSIDRVFNGMILLSLGERRVLVVNTRTTNMMIVPLLRSEFVEFVPGFDLYVNPCADG